MKKLLFAAIVIGTVSLTSCKSGGGDPKPALMNFMEALNKQDFEGAKKYATSESATMLDMAKNMGAKKEESGKYDLNKLEVGEPKINGDIATIPVKIKENGMSLNYKMKKESGAWKVAFDKSSLMSMGMDAMSQNTDKLNISDSMKAAMEKYKDLPLDSLKSVMKDMKSINADSLTKEALQEARKELDSAKHK